MVNDCHRRDVLMGLTRKYAAWKAEKEWRVNETAQIADSPYLRSPQIHRANQADETLVKSNDFNLADQPEHIYIKPDLPGNNSNSLTDFKEGAHHCASQTNSGDTDKSKSCQQNPESTVSSGLETLADQPENIYIKPDLPGNNQNSLRSDRDNFNPLAQTNSLDSSQSLSARSKNLETTVESGLDNLAHQPDSIYIKPDVPAEIQDSLIIENKLGNSDNSDQFSQDCPNQKQNLESTVVTGLDNLAHQPESIYIKPDVPGNSQADRGNLLTQLLTSLSDLESQLLGFTSREELNQFIQKIEMNAAQIEPQLLATCPDYFERLVEAVANLKLGEPDSFDEVTQIEIPSDSPLKVGDRFYHSLDNSYGIVMGLMPISGRASVLFDGEVTTKNISDDRLVKLQMFSCDRSQLLKTVDKLKEILANQDSLDSIRELGVELFKAAQQYLAQTVGAKLVAQLAFAIKSLDYELYMRFF